MTNCVEFTLPKMGGGAGSMVQRYLKKFVSLLQAQTLTEGAGRGACTRP